MSDLTPTRSLLIALADERRTMREGYAFLDEKCLLLAGEMLRQVRVHQGLSRELAALMNAAHEALTAALLRHGLHGLQVYPATVSRRRLRAEPQPLLGEVTLRASVIGEAGQAAVAANPTPEAEACRVAWTRVADHLAHMAAVSTTLARLHAEYRRTVRRVRALQDVLLPELDADIADIDTRLEDLEREDAIAMRFRGGIAAGP
jgi:V/A-type H+-transporting ATPase subunit D